MGLPPVRRIIRTGVVVAVGLIAWRVGTAGWSGYVRVWQVWAEGVSTGGLALWGQPVLWWGRAGKLLQFMAGLAVVLDLLGPESLRAIGDRASDRCRHYRECLRVVRILRSWRMAREIFWSLYDKHTVYDGRGGAFSDFRLRSVPKPLAKPLPHIDDEALAGFQEELLETLRVRHPEPPRVSWTASHPIIFAFLRERMPAHLRVSPAATSTWVRWDNRVVVPVIGVLLLLLPPLIMAGYVGEVGKHLFGEEWGGPAAVVGGVLAIFGLPVIQYGLLAMLTLFWLPLATVAKLLAVTLDRQRPGHALRWIALGLFVVGFHFDLLAS